MIPMNAAEEKELEKLVGKDETVDEFAGTLARFKRLDQRKPGESWILLGYGPSKTGKTEFAGTCGDRTLIINTGEGLETLMSPGFRQRHPDCTKPIIVDIREGTGVASAFDEVGETIDLALAKFPEKFDQVVIDEATGLRKFALNRGMELATESRTRATRASRTDEFVNPDIGDYGMEMKLVEWFLATYIPKLKAAKKHFIMLAHERQTFAKPPKIGDDPILKRITPGFTGKTFPDQVPSYFDDVFRFEVVGGGINPVYRLRTAGTELELGGARHGGIFPAQIQNPDFQKMLKQIRDSHGK